MPDDRLGRTEVLLLTRHANCCRFRSDRHGGRSGRPPLPRPAGGDQHHIDNQLPAGVQGVGGVCLAGSASWVRFAPEEPVSETAFMAALFSTPRHLVKLFIAPTACASYSPRGLRRCTHDTFNRRMANGIGKRFPSTRELYVLLKLVRRFDRSMNNSCCLFALRNIASMERIVD